MRLWAWLLAAGLAGCAKSSIVSFDQRSILINGKRKMLLSGSVHYMRILPSDWNKTFALASELGLNTIQTYVAWNFHEPHLRDRNNATWTGRANLSKFIEAAASNGLYVNLRIGPFICGEYYFGGIPLWLRGFENVSCFRCDDTIWKQESQRWLSTVVDYVRPLLLDNGGPVIMLQVENEYNGGSQDYLDWAVDMATNTTKGLSVPWSLCHDLELCSSVNHRSEASGKAICTINGFWMEEFNKNPSQPSPIWIDTLRRLNPMMPTVWTEDQGWFDEWKVAKRVRSTSDQLYGIARFFAYGGSWHNFYMLTGGSNFGRQSGGEVVTAYAPDTVISPMLLRHQPRFGLYQKFFRAIANYSNALLSSASIPVPVRFNSRSRRLRGRSGHTAKASANPVLMVEACTDTDPSHIGVLDASQQFSLQLPESSSFGHFLNNVTGTSLCLSATSSVAPVSLQPCSSSSDLLWEFNQNQSSQLRSKAQYPCQAPGMKGKSCNRCLDYNSQLTLWDCKGDKDKELGNQKWGLDAKEEHGMRHSESGNCLTAVSSGNDWAEYVEYIEVDDRNEAKQSGLAFLSNLHMDHPVKVIWRGQQYLLMNHSVTLGARFDL